MFFVGSTGQLLTLILTVALPFIVLVSGQQNIEIQNITSFLEFETKTENFGLVENNSFEKQIEVEEKKERTWPLFIEVVHLRKIHICRSIKEPKQFCLHFSGNKAPPEVFHFIC